VKKKYSVSPKDKRDWSNFTKEIDNISIKEEKEEDLLGEEHYIYSVRKLDLHGFSLREANKAVKKFIIESYEKNYTKLLIVTGKGKRSKSYDDPYISQDLSILRNSVPEYLKKDLDLISIIRKVKKADPQHGGDGALNIFLKNNKKFIK